MAAVLWHLEISHYNEKARWALDYKSIPHVRRTPLPGLHGLYALAITRGAQRRLPVLELEGRRIGDSTAIIAALERYQPDPALYPATHSLIAAATPNEYFSGSRSDGSANGLRISVLAFENAGEPESSCGFHIGKFPDANA
jgi:hypothetical protein